MVQPEWFEKVGAPDDSELDMLDLAAQVEETSRLGCQIVTLLATCLAPMHPSSRSARVRGTRVRGVVAD